MIVPSRWAAILIAAALPASAALVALGCNKDDPQPSAEPAAVEHPGWLDNNDRKILELAVEVAKTEPDPEKSVKTLIRTIAELETQRLPASWTGAALTAGEGTAATGSQAMWTALMTKPDLAEPVNAICNHGQTGLENIGKVAQSPEMFWDLIFRHCKVEEIGFFKRSEVGDPEHAVLGFAAVAYHALDEKKIMSPEEAAALRQLVRSFSAYFHKNRVPGQRPRAPYPMQPTARPSARPAPSAAPSAASSSPTP